MADLSITFDDFQDGATIIDSEFDTNFTEIVNYINARNNNNVKWDALGVVGPVDFDSTLNVDGNTTLVGTVTVTGAGTFNGATIFNDVTTFNDAATFNAGIVSLFSYRSPNLIFSSITQVDIENNTGTVNTTTILFPDGTLRTVTEDTSSTNKFRRFDITATAEFTSGTEDSGLFSGESETNNTWYAMYAIKSLIDVTKFVMVGTTILPIQANFATLNTNFGINGWKYLGLIRNGDDAANLGDLLNFRQNGAVTMFTNVSVAQVRAGVGIRMADTASANTLTYTYVSGTGSKQIPSHIDLVMYRIHSGFITSNVTEMRNAGSTQTYAQADNGISSCVLWAWMNADEGCLSNNLVAGNVKHDIFLQGYIDPILSSPHALL